jgi:hypothetical protein
VLSLGLLQLLAMTAQFNLATLLFHRLFDQPIQFIFNQRAELKRNLVVCLHRRDLEQRPTQLKLKANEFIWSETLNINTGKIW